MQLYRPWGETHYTSGSLLTQYQYTGQWKSASGLYWYNSRWYDSALGRFVQPDTLIPDPYNTLDWDRYSYARYNPMKYIDPSGHKACSESGDTLDDCKDPLGITADEFGKKYGVDFRGRWPTENLKWRIILATIFVGRALQHATGAATAASAFNAIYGSVTFTWGPCPSCGGAFGYTYSAHSIEFRGMYQNSILAIRNIIHELGHAFDHGVCEARTNGCISPDNVWNSGVRSDLIGMMGLCSNGPNCLGRNGHSNLTGGFWGFAKDWGEWQFGASNEPGEIWADMFLGWVFSAWETSPRGTIREAYMNQQMPGYVDLFLGY